MRFTSGIGRRASGVSAAAGAAAALVGLATATPASAAPILEYRFNSTYVDGSTTFTPSGGTDPTPGRVQSPGALGAAASGVSGKPDDRAFVNGGTSAAGGRVDHGADDNAIDTLQSFTYSGWLRSNTTTPLTNGRIMENGSAPLILFTAAGSFQIQVDGNTTGFFADSGNFYSATQTWMFFAVTYDGTQTANNVKFYRGFRSAAEAPGGVDPAVTLVATATINQGAANSEGSALNLFNRSGNDRSLDAAADNFRVDGTQAAGSAAGALSQAQLEAYRTVDLIPEPGTAGLAAAAVGVGLLRRRPRRA